MISGGRTGKVSKRTFRGTLALRAGRVFGDEDAEGAIPGGVSRKGSLGHQTKPR